VPYHRLVGQGKSRAAEAMLRQDVLELDGVPRGGVLIDPHGTLFGSALRWYVTHSLHRVRPIRVLDPSDPRAVFHLNPLRRRPGVDPAVIASAVVNAVLRVWGGDATATPQLRTTLKHTFYTLCELGLPLTRAADLLDLTDASGLRAFAADHVSNPVVRQFWRELDALRLARREERVGSAMRRLTEFLLPARVRAIFGNAERALDWRQVMDDGEIVLVNLAFDSGRLSEDEAQVIGVMMLAEIFLACQGRPEGSLPFYLYVDECHRVLTEDIAKVIVEGRKFGVHAGVLIHQTIGQLREAGEFVMSAIMAARTKIVFGGLEPDDAEHMARSIFRGQFDLSRDKEKFRRPVVVGQELAWLLSESESHGSSHAVGATWSAGRSVAHSTSTTRSFSRSVGESDTVSASRTSNRTRTAGTTETAGTTTSMSLTDSQSLAQSRSATKSSSISEQWGNTDSRSTGWSSGETRSASRAKSIALSQRLIEADRLGERDRRERQDDPARGARITDTEAETTGRATATGRSAMSGVADTFGGSRSRGEATTQSNTATAGRAVSVGSADSRSVARSASVALGEGETRGSSRTRSVADTSGIACTEGVTRSESWSEGGSVTDTVSEALTTGRSQALRSVFEVLPSTPTRLRSCCIWRASRSPICRPARRSSKSAGVRAHV
jgi:hypothetical protein